MKVLFLCVVAFLCVQSAVALDVNTAQASRLRRLTRLNALVNDLVADPNQPQNMQASTANKVEAKAGGAPPALAKPAEFNYKQQGRDWTGVCQTGKHQSPIDLTISQTPKGPAPRNDTCSAMEFHYVPANNLKIVNNGHGLVVDGTFGSVSTDGAKYNAQSLRFHAPSEHTLGGERYEAEMQIVHQKEGSSGNSDLLILSLLFTHGPENPFLKSLAWTEKGLPKASGNSTEIGTVDLNVFGKLLQDSFFCYQGSLTVPPCEETVSWKVMADPTTMSHAQQKAVCGLFEQNPNFAEGKGNNRLTQNARNDAIVVKKFMPVPKPVVLPPRSACACKCAAEPACPCSCPH